MNNRILFVDDDYDVLSAYERNLRKIYSVNTALSGVEALGIIRESATFAVVVSDYKMPQINGIDFLAEVRKISPDTVRIIITGYADMQICIDAVNEGNVYRFLTKPYPTE
ncbi:MAG: response regulator, partial [FCB group bacterium]